MLEIVMAMLRCDDVSVAWDTMTPVSEVVFESTINISLIQHVFVDFTEQPYKTSQLLLIKQMLMWSSGPVDILPAWCPQGRGLKPRSGHLQRFSYGIILNDYHSVW